MSLKSTIRIAINFSSFTISQYHRTGTFHYIASVYCIAQEGLNADRRYAFVTAFNQQSQCSKNLKQYELVTVKSLSQPNISQDRLKFTSRKVNVNFSNRNFSENCTCQWKINLNVEEFEKMDFFVEVQLVFTSMQNKDHSHEKQIIKYHNKKADFFQQQSQIVSKFTGKINKPYDIFSFLPVSFDELGSLQLNATYHAIVSCFTFIPQQQQKKTVDLRSSFFSFGQQLHKPKFYSFKEYLDNVTSEFLSSKVRRFYEFYTGYLMNFYDGLNKRNMHYKKVLNIKGNDKMLGNGINKNNHLKQSKQFASQFDVMYRHHQNIQQFQRSKQLMSQIIMKDLSNISKMIETEWSLFNKFVQKTSQSIIKHQERLYIPLIEQRYLNDIFSHKVKLNADRDFTYSRYDDSGLSHLQHAQKENQKRISESGVWKGQFLIQDLNWLQKEQKNIKMFEERYQIDRKQIKTLTRAKTQKSIEFITSSTENYSDDFDPNPKQLRSFLSHSSLHIIFLVHGFGASKIDMFLLKKFIEMKYNAKVIISIENVGKTEDSIDQQGERFASEVKKNLRQIDTRFKLSFIGHSMGGLVIRSAIPRLQKYRSNMHTYISICTPHLGYLYEPSNLTKFGLWMLNRMQFCQSLAEVQMRDHPSKLRHCQLYRLSMNGSLNNFKHVAFIASSQDSYVPYESARVQKSQKLLNQLRYKDQLRQTIIRQMIDNMLKELKLANQLSRIDVVFNIEKKISLQAIIGRVGHVKFLSDEQFIKEFVICFKRFFQ